MINHFLFLNTVVYTPFALVILGIWIERKRAELLPFLIYLIIMYSTLSLIFTIPSTHGTFFHSLVALLPFLYAWAITGIDTTLAYINKQSGKGHKYAVKIIDFFRTLQLKSSTRFLKIAMKDVSLVFLAIAMVIAAIVAGKAGLTASAGTDNYTLYQQVGKIVASDYKANRMLHNSELAKALSGKILCLLWNAKHRNRLNQDSPGSFRQLLGGIGY